MNIVQITESAAVEIPKKIWTFDAYMYAKYTNLDTVVLKDFRITVETKKFSFVDMWIRIIPVEEIPEDAMEDIVSAKHVIHFVNFYDKKDPAINLYDQEFIAPESDFAKCSIYVCLQFVQKDGERMLDLYMEPADDDEAFRNYDDTQKFRRAIMALLFLDYVDSRIKKERHLIKRIMPTPKQIAQADKTGERLSTDPIKIRDISVQYIYEPHESRKYQRHCEAWGVRGHYRHYKSGKVIYIQPHTKGKGSIKNTTYII